MGFDKDKPDAYLDENEIQVENYSDLENYSNLARSSNGKYVVVLDPGHDDTHTGAAANGISEKDINLKIAKYCKQELESYYGVQVYMTRTTSTCPYPGTTSTDDNAKRVEYAKVLVQMLTSVSIVIHQEIVEQVEQKYFIQMQIIMVILARKGQGCHKKYWIISHR